MTASPADAGSTGAGAETCPCGDFAGTSVVAVECSVHNDAVPSPKDTVEPGWSGQGSLRMARAVGLEPMPTPPAARTGEDEADSPRDVQVEALAVAIRECAEEPASAEEWAENLYDCGVRVGTAHIEVQARVSAALDSLSREAGAFEAGYKGWAQRVVRDVRRAALSARPLVSGTANRDDVARERVADELPRHTDVVRQHGAGYELSCNCGWRGPKYVQAYPELGRMFRLHLADELLALLGGDQDNEDGAR